MKKRILYIIAVVAMLISCNKEKMGARHLNRGNGTWQIETIELTYFDSVGNILKDSIINEPGEIVFLSTSWGVAPEYLGMYLHFDSNKELDSTYNFDYYSDGKRLTISASGVTLPILLVGQFTMEKNNRRKQIWNAYVYFNDPSFSNRISVKETITLSKGKSF